MVVEELLHASLNEAGRRAVAWNSQRNHDGDRLAAAGQFHRSPASALSTMVGRLVRASAMEYRRDMTSMATMMHVVKVLTCPGKLTVIGAALDGDPGRWDLIS
jgi:hypothetical protein